MEVLGLSLDDYRNTFSFPSMTIPDLTDRIVRSVDDQYCETGGFGDVFRCRYTCDDGVKEVAVKAFRFGFTVDEYQQGGEKTARMIRRELGIWRRLSHRNIVPFLGIVYGFGRRGNASLVSTWMPHGTMHTFLNAHDDQLAVAHRLRLASKIDKLLDIANGLHYLHAFPLIHGDLSSSNVLIDHDYNARLTDFGYASLVGEFPEGFTYLKMSTTRPGTLRWAAPEHFSPNGEETEHNIKSDIYSFGNMTLLVLSGKYPWSEVRSDPAVTLSLSQGLKPGRPLLRPIDDRHWTLIEWCWSSIPERPHASDVISSLEQHLAAYPPPPPLCDLLDVPASSSSSVPICPGSDYRDEITSEEPPLDLARCSTPSGTGASASLQAPTSGDARPLVAQNQSVTNESGGDTTISRHSFSTPSCTTFIVDAEYEFVKELGQGVHGCVVATRHRRSGEGCAIKKITNIHTTHALTKRCLRRIRLLQHFRGHKNITCLYDMDIVFQPGGNFDEVYLYEELMGADLHAIIRSGQPLTDAQVQSFICQTLCGLTYIHSAYVLHRDLKPGNLFVNADCELKICGFDVARGYTPGGVNSRSAGNQGFMTEYVARRCYRAPEVMLSFGNYTTAIDIWSVGCILTELLGGKPILEGRNYDDQLNQILHYLGTPSEDTLSRVGSPRAQDYIRSLPIKPRVPFATLYPHANPHAIDLLSQMLCFDPAKRISCEQALNHAYLQVRHDPANERVCETTFDFSFEQEDSIEAMKKLIAEEVSSFRKEVRAQAGAAGQVCRPVSLPIPSRNEILSLPLRELSDACHGRPER